MEVRKESDPLERDLQNKEGKRNLNSQNRDKGKIQVGNSITETPTRFPGAVFSG